MIGKISAKKRMKNSIFITLTVITALILRIGYLQFVEGSTLKQKAYLQQTSDRAVSAKRGTIYDATGKTILAVSSTVETVTVNPTNIKEEDKEKVAQKLSELFELDYEQIIKKVKKRSSIETIVKKVDKEKTNELRNWMEENKITEGINIDEDSKRYYPLNNLASQIIGFCGSDNQGLNGIEAKYDEYLKGKAGAISRITDASGGIIDDTSEEYIEPQDGDDIVLTIDATIQGIAEKYLKEACIDNKCTDGGNIIVMSLKTGDILALASYPNYNLNDPFAVDENLSKDEQNKQMQALWRNKAISDTYEPGSTFKLVTTSAALEEGITTPDKAGEFSCIGYIDVAGVKMKCWRYYRPHGSESLRQALMNSCNPVFIGLGQKIGVKKYYQYLNKFGFFNTTGIDLPGEANSIFLKEDKVGPVELGTISFGQRFEVTPIQMATMLSTIANGGIYVKPRVVKQIISNTETDENGAKKITNIEVKNGERVISEKTAKEVLSMMQTVVDEGTGKNAKVEGYSIGGKTGTSEDGVNTNKYVTSFIGTAPIEDPQVVVLVTLYNPTGEGGHQGGGVAAPVGGEVFSEILPYLEIEKNIQEEKNSTIN